jgi:dTDP-L-rhamnose 4-epimerase
VHLAAETGTGQSMYEIERYVDVNVRGTAILLELIAQAPTRASRIVVASSRAVYGEGAAACAQHGVVFPAPRRAQDMVAGKFHLICPECGAPCVLHPTAENAPLEPRSVYAQTKLSQEQLTLILGQSLSLPAIALRYQNVYGPGQSLRNPYTGILSIFSNAILEGKPIRIFEDGEESRDFVHVEDVARLTADALETPVCGAFNVGSGECISVNEVVTKLAKALGRPANARVSGEFREGDIRHSAADLTRIRREYGFQPTRNFEEGLKSLVTWVKSQAPEGSRYLESLVEMRSAGLLKSGPAST